MSATPRYELRLGHRRLEAGVRPLLMGILNATPDSFSDGPGERDPATRAGRGRALFDAGADVVDVGGESGVTNSSPIGVPDEVERVVPLIGDLAGGGALVSVDTYKAAVAAAA